MNMKEEDVNERTIGEIIRSERKRLNLSQKQLAEKMGKEQSYISQVETGVYVPTLNTLGSFANAGIRLSELLKAIELKPTSLIA